VVAQEQIENFVQETNMKRTRIAIGIAAALMTSLVACNKQPSTTSADSPTTSADTLQPRRAPAAAVTPVADRRPEPRVTVPAGTKLRVSLLQAVSSDKSQTGDAFLATLTEPIVVEGKTVVAKGTKVRGRVVDAKESGRVKGRASLELTLTQIVPDEGKSIGISTKPYVAVAESTKKRDGAIIGGGAGLGAAIGAIAGGGKGALIGAAVGGGAGTGTVLATKGKEVRFGVEHPLSFTLSSSIEI
jgi:hypothetical protein